MNSSQVLALYLADSELYTHKTVVTNVAARWIELKETIFHPKGGGQPSDEGTINGIKVIQVQKEMPDKSQLNQFKIYHHFENDHHFKIGDVVELVIDAPTRTLHCRLHTAGHLLAEVVNSLIPQLKPYQGHHYPEGSYVKFKMSDASFDIEKQNIAQECTAWIAQDQEITTCLLPSGLRSVNGSPCGGTHVKRLSEIRQMEITDISINKKDQSVTIKYKL